jgi:RimJ/RimL family protein N-acetyltransferase
MNDSSERSASEEYTIGLCLPGDLSDEERERCITLIAEGDALDERFVRDGMPKSRLVAVAKRRGQIVGVAVIKGDNRDHARTVARESKFAFPPETPELGYVSVDGAHKNQHLSTRLIEALLSRQTGPLYSTTRSDRIKHILGKLGFTERGEHWQGRKGKPKLSLWFMA